MSRTGGSRGSRVARPMPAAASVSTTTLATTASQMRTYNFDVKRVHILGDEWADTGRQTVRAAKLILLLGKHVAHTPHRKNALGLFGVDFNGVANAAHVHVN